MNVLATSRYRTDFIANMSHELRAPLNSLLVLAEQLEDNPDGNLTERQVQYAGVIRSSGGDLLTLLDDITDLAKAEADALALEIREVSLDDLGEAMAQIFIPVAVGQGMGFWVEIDEALPECVVTDPYRLRQVLRNLLSNAFRFASHGKVFLRMDLRTGGWDPDHHGLATADSVIALSVSDTGLGIHPDRHEEMFEAFAHGEPGTHTPHGGTGLGLPISRSLVRMLGGEITLESSPGEGSTFTVFLPIRTTAAPAAIVAETFEGSIRPARHEADPEGSTVLLVDNDARNRFAMTVVLERLGVHVVVAQSGAAALTILDERADIDVVLMDIVMPVMNGYETMAEIRTRSRYAGLPVVALTGNVTGGERGRCLAAGASDYLAKPIDAASLHAILARWVTAAPPTDVEVSVR
jgi:CheY-like chemotaxis protein/nitrogen-specific signal transduction histidine kinase